MLRVFFFQTFKHEVNRGLKFRVVLAGFRRIYHFKQRREVLLVLWGFIPDIADKGAVKEPFGLYPEILPGFFPVAFGIGDYGMSEADCRRGASQHPDGRSGTYRSLARDPQRSDVHA